MKQIIHFFKNTGVNTKFLHHFSIILNLLIFISVMMFSCNVSQASVPTDLTRKEREIGKRAMQELESVFTFIDDKALDDSLTTMANDLSALTERPGIEYKVRVISGNYPNAFTVPGGYIFFTDEMLREVRSPDELAGILAHEIAHNTRMHTLKRMEDTPLKSKLLSWASLAVLVIGGGSGESQAASIALSAAGAAILNGFILEQEVEADSFAMGYLLKSKYNPVGYLTLWERMSLGSSRFMEESLGIYRTHPTSRQRVFAARRFLERHGVKILRRKVNGAPGPVITHERSKDGSIYFSIRFMDSELLRIASTPNEGESQSRVERVTKIIDDMLDNEITRHEIEIEIHNDGTSEFHTPYGCVIITAEDAHLYDMTPVEVAHQLSDKIVSLVEGEKTRINAMYAMF